MRAPEYRGPTPQPDAGSDSLDQNANHRLAPGLGVDTNIRRPSSRSAQQLPPPRDESQPLGRGHRHPSHVSFIAGLSRSRITKLRPSGLAVLQFNHRLQHITLRPSCKPTKHSAAPSTMPPSLRETSEPSRARRLRTACTLRKAVVVTVHHVTY